MNTAEMIFPELALARSKTRFQEMVTRGTRNIQCFQTRGVEITNVERGCVVHVTVGCDPFPLQVIHMSIKLYLYHTPDTAQAHVTFVYELKSWSCTGAASTHIHTQAVRPPEYLTFSVDTCEKRN